VSRFDRLGKLFERHGHRVYPGWAKEALRRFARELPPGARVLDLGGGTGLLAGWMREVRPDLELVVADASRGMLARVPEGIQAVHARAEALPFPDASFDAVVLGEALHHFADPEAALSEVARVLAPGGRLWVYDFDPRPLGGRLLRFLERLWGEPAAFYPPEALLEALAARGLRGRVEARGFRYVLSGERSENAAGRSSPSR